jgi:CubicO group peptidase (beta-lactamase class C family)
LLAAASGEAEDGEAGEHQRAGRGLGGLRHPVRCRITLPGDGMTLARRVTPAPSSIGGRVSTAGSLPTPDQVRAWTIGAISIHRLPETPMTVKPESVGMCSQRLARLDRFLAERYVNPGKLPCALLQVARGGQLVHQSVLGQASLETGAALAEDSIVRIYSMTKPITSVAFMMLVEQGLVALDDPVHRFIPSWRDLRVYVAGLPGAFQTRPTEAPMRIVDLLRHTSGLTYGFQTRTNVDAAYRHRKVEPFEQTEGLQGFVDALAELPLEFSPGTAWNYSVSTDVLGYLVGKISGMPFDQFLRQRIFEPLGMVDTDFHVGDDRAGRFAQCYTISGAGALVPMQGRTFREPAAAPSGGGGLVSTAGDYMRFCEMLRRGGALGDVRLIGRRRWR